MWLGYNINFRSIQLQQARVLGGCFGINNADKPQPVPAANQRKAKMPMFPELDSIMTVSELIKPFCMPFAIMFSAARSLMSPAWV